MWHDPSIVQYHKSHSFGIRSCRILPSSRYNAFLFAGLRLGCLLKGSWDLVTRVINKAAILIVTSNPGPNKVSIAVLIKHHEPPSTILEP